MKILVTGGSGLVGKAIKKITSNYDHDFVFMSSKECNLIDYNETLEYFSSIKPDYVIHLAANVGGLFKNMNHKVEMLEDNLMINTNVLKCAYLSGVKNLVACLSTCIFPDNTSYPIDETMLHNGPPHHSNDSYAYAKRLLEVQCRSYNEQYKTNYICVIPTNIYGPHDNFNLEDSHVIPGLIHQCYLAQLNETPFIVKGTGKPLRQFIYSLDLARLILIILLDSCSHGPIILSPQEEVSISYISVLITKEINYPGEVIFDTSYSDGQYKKTVSNNKLMKLIDDFHFTPIEEGIKQTIEWFKREYPNVRK